MASLSYSQNFNSECPVCGAQVSGQAWIVLDFEESPDLWEQFRRGSLNLITCPNQHPLELKTPILLHDWVLKRLFFFMVETLSKTENEQIQKQLLKHHEAALYARARGEEYHIGQHVSVPVTLSALAEKAGSSDAAQRGKALRLEDFKLTLKEIFSQAGSDAYLRAELCKTALASLNRDEEPFNWAVLNALLGNSLVNSEVGDESENVEQAIRALEGAMTVLTPDTSPEYWGMVNSDLGVAYGSRSIGDLGNNVEMAIRSLKSALLFYSREKAPNEWADTSIRLGIQYRRRPEGEAPANIRNAIRHFEDALSVYTYESSPEKWADIQARIGIAYALLVDGDRPNSIDRSIEATEGTLRFYSPEEFPSDWAAAQNRLANLYSQRTNGDLAANLNNAIKACEAAFTIYRPDSFPFEWADTQTILGISLLKRATEQATLQPEASEQLEHAISAFESALTVFRPKVHPGQWMSALSNLANAYQERVSGDKASNIEHAIQLYQEILVAIDKQVFPERWAAVQVNLADAYTKRIKGSPGENLRKALAAYEATTTVKPAYQGEELFAKAQGGIFTAFSGHEEENTAVTERLIRVCEASIKTDVYNASPERWAGTQLLLSATYRTRLRGDRADNIERALEACRAALTVFTPESSMEDWVHARLILADLYLERPSGGKAENIEEAIRIYQELLSLLSQSSPEEWARVQLDLARAFGDRVNGSRADNLELSIHACEAALTVFSYDQSPKRWAAGQLELGFAYCKRIYGSREENIEAAIIAFESAQRVYTREASPSAWATLQNNLGNAYSDRIAGNSADNIEKAIRAFELALEGHSRIEDPARWASSQANLGSAYLRRARGERAENIERAIKAYKAALSVFSPRSHPGIWANIQASMGGAYLKRMVGDEDENIDRAIQYLEAALTLDPDQIDPTDRGAVQLNLVSAYLSRSKRTGENEEDQELALNACEGALSFLTPEDFPEQWLILQSHLSNIYSARLKGNRGDNLGRSIQALESVLTDYYREAFPDRWATVQFQLGNAYLKRDTGDHDENLERAVQAYKAALEVHLPAESPASARRAAFQLGKVLSRQNKWEEAYAALLSALEAAEYLYSTAISYEGKVAEIVEDVSAYKLLVWVCLRLTPARRGEALRYAEEGRARLLRDQLGELSFPPPPEIPSPLIEREQSLLHTLRGLDRAAQVSSDETMRQIWVGEMETVRAELKSLWDRMARDYQAASYVALRSKRTLEWDDVQRWLFSLERQAAVLEFVTLNNQLVVFIVRRGELEPRIVEIDLTSLRLLDFVRRLRKEVSHFDADDPCDETWRRLAPLLLPKIMPNLEGVELVYIVADEVLHYLPLHALEYDGEPLISYFPIVYIPSIAVALRIHHYSSTSSRPQTRDATRRFLVIGNPTGDLPFAEEEAKEVAQQLKVRPLLRNEASLTSVQSRMTEKDLAHFASHAYFHPHDPFASGIILADGHVLTAEDVLAESLGVNLLVLSGCETGRQSIGPGNELTGLANALLYAGVSSLILSQWPVSDAVTAKLMRRFYRRLYDVAGEMKTSAAEALRGAMMETRAENPHTYHWAPFFLFGQ